MRASGRDERWGRQRPGERRDTELEALRRDAHYERLGRLLCLGGAAIGVIGLVGWILDEPFLRVFLPGRPEMKLNTAISLLLLGVAAMLRSPSISRRALKAVSALAATLALTLAVATLTEYVAGIDLGIDTLILPQLGGPFPGRPSPPTALAIGLLAAGVLAFDLGQDSRLRPTEVLVLGGGCVALVALLGLVFGVGLFYRLASSPVTGVALPTSVALLAITAGLLCLRPSARMMAVVLSPGPGGVLLRVFIPAFILAPILLESSIEWLLSRLGLRERALIFATTDTAITILGLGLLFVTAERLNRTASALEGSRQRLREVIHQAPDGIFLTDLEGRFQELNEAASEMIGCMPEEARKHDMAEYLPPEDFGRLLMAQQQVMDGDVHVGEWTLRRTDGSTLPVEVSMTLLPGDRWQWMVRDIVDRKRAEEALRTSEERVALAVRGAKLGTWDWDIATGKVVFNERWAEMRGYRLDELRPHIESFLSGLHPDDGPVVERALKDYFEGRAPEYETEFRVRTRSGRWIWVLDSGKVFARDQSDRPTRMAGVELDITARKEMDERLRVAEARSSGILAISADAIVSVDEEQRITAFNAGAERIFGYARAEILGKPLETLIPERFHAAHRAHFAMFAAAPESSRRMGTRDKEIVGVRSNGEEFPADASISKLEVDSKMIFTVSVRDTTVQKRLEEDLRRAVQAREDILGIVAHDLRNPLGTVLMDAELIRVGEDGSGPRAHDPVASIERSVRRMDRLIQDLLDVSRIEKGSLSIEPASLQVEQVIAEAVAAQQPHVHAASLELRHEFPPGLPAIRADRDRLQQVLGNLIVNAVKFTPSGGRITVGAALRPPSVLFWVSDTGRGIPPEHMQRLFEPFWQATKGEKGGLGLGLPISRGIVEAQGGRMWAESRPGGGSTFFFTVPVATEPVAGRTGTPRTTRAAAD